MSLKHTIGMLAKSSAQAVTTLAAANPDAEELKEYLYVQTPVEASLRAQLADTDPKRIVFLCGSSGDGKSEIFRRIHDEFSDRFDFHLDATHSFDPGKDAIQTLNDVFERYNSGDRPLVVGINIGMLGNFAADGDAFHDELKETIDEYLAGNAIDHPEFFFVNFEDYPKFELDGDRVVAPFIGPLLQRICEARDDNPIYRSYQTLNRDSQAARNYRLLSTPEVQTRICNLLFYVHLKFDQFLTARTVLDFVYQLITGKGTLVDNLFCSKGSALMDALGKLDPSHARSKELDLFQVKASLGLFEPEFTDFKADIQKLYGIGDQEPRSWVRLFYVLQKLDVSNNYHHRFRDDLQRDLFDEYKRIWQLHRDYKGDREAKKALRSFYNDSFIAAVTSFANRFAPELRRDRFLLGKPNGYALSARAKLHPAYKRIAENKPHHLRSFDAELACDVHELDGMPVTVSFLELVRRINRGYRPNTHDKTTVVVLEELVEAIRRHVRQTEVLYVQHGGEEWSLIDDHYEDEILVER